MTKVAGIQIDLKLGEVETNLERIEQYTNEATGEGAKLIVFPECAVTGYCFESYEEAKRFAQPIPGPATERLAKVAKTQNVNIVAGMLELSGDDVFNAAICVGPNGEVSSYRKAHLPQLGVDHFTTPGDRPFTINDAGDLKIGMLICYDASFPEATRILSLAGADLIVLPTNWPPGAEQTADYVINARASENKVYFIAVNRVGRERGFQFIGKSKICDVNGNTLAMADHQDEAIIYADIDPAEARVKRIERVAGKHSIDRFADRRPDLYGPITESK